MFWALIECLKRERLREDEDTGTRLRWIEIDRRKRDEWGALLPQCQIDYTIVGEGLGIFVLSRIPTPTRSGMRWRVRSKNCGN